MAHYDVPSVIKQAVTDHGRINEIEIKTGGLSLIGNKIQWTSAESFDLKCSDGGGFAVYSNYFAIRDQNGSGDCRIYHDGNMYGSTWGNGSSAGWLSDFLTASPWRSLFAQAYISHAAGAGYEGISRAAARVLESSGNKVTVRFDLRLRFSETGYTALSVMDIPAGWAMGSASVGVVGIDDGLPVVSAVYDPLTGTNLTFYTQATLGKNVAVTVIATFHR